MVTQLRSVGDDTHVVGALTVANYALNPSFEVLDTSQLKNTRVNLCPNPSFGTDLTGWSVGGTVSPTISQSFARSVVGTSSLKVVWGTGGTLPLVQGPTLPTTSGQSYTVSVYVYVPTGSPAIGINITNGGSLSGATTTTNQWQRISQTFTATSTSSTVQFWPGSSPTAGQYAFLDAVLYENSSTLNSYFDGTYDLTIARTNLCTNPSFETGTTGWSTGGGVPPTIATSTTQKVFGKQSMLVTWAASGGSFPLVQSTFNTVIGTTYTVSAHVYVPSGSSTVLLTVAGFSLQGQTSSIFNDWQRLSFTFVATATSHAMQLIETNPIAGTVYVEGALFEASGSLSGYFDGSLPSFLAQNITHAWTGTVGTSTSTQTVPASVTAWTSTANESTSTRNDCGPANWVSTNATVICTPTMRDNALFSAKIVPTITSAAPQLSQTITALDNSNYSISFRIFIPAAITGGGINLTFANYDVTNTLIQLDTLQLLQSGNPTLGYIRLAQTYGTPAGTATLTISVTTPNLPALTDVIYLDDFLIELADTSSPSYLDGNFVGYCWSGAVNNSTTLLTEPSASLSFFASNALDVPPSPPPAGNIPMAARGQVLPTSWPFVPLTD